MEFRWLPLAGKGTNADQDFLAARQELFPETETARLTAERPNMDSEGCVPVRLFAYVAAVFETRDRFTEKDLKRGATQTAHYI